MFTLLSRIRSIRSFVGNSVLLLFTGLALASFALACGGSGGGSDSTPLKSPSIVSFTATPATIKSGDKCTLHWVAPNAASFNIDPGVGKVNATSYDVKPTATTTYTLTATGSGGTATATVTVTVISDPPSITSFTATPDIIKSGDSSTLSWVATNATSYTIDPGVGTVNATSVTVSPTATTTYTLTATGSGGTDTATVTVSVVPPQPFLKVDGTKIRTNKGQGSEVLLHGTNLGGWLLQENWMSPLGGDDEVAVRTTLTTRFDADTCESLIAAFQDTWIQSYDLDQIQKIGLNFVRVPIYYRDLVTDDGTNWAWKTDPWTRLDWLVTECGKRGIYVMLDMHGAPGCQNMWDNCGDSNSDPQFWKDTKYQDMTNDIWKGIATHFNGQEWVLGYDLLNEPSGASGAAFNIDATTLNNIYDRFYKTIRAVDADHIIVMEGFPGTNGLQSPTIKGWTNVMYEWHSYAMGTYKGDLNMLSMWTQQDSVAKSIISTSSDLKTQYNVPIYIGEFCVANFLDVWESLLAGLNQAGIHWSPWTYKVTGGDPSKGDYGTNWGLFIHGTGTKPTIASDTSSAIETAWKTWDTEKHFEPNTNLINIVKTYAAGSTTVPAPTAVFYSIKVNGSYVSADADSVPFTGLPEKSEIPMIANRTSANDWEAFELLDNSDGTISIRAKITASYVVAEGLPWNNGPTGNWYLTPRSATISDWEKFTKTDLGDGTFSLKSLGSGKYVGLDSSDALIANSDTPVAFTFTEM